MTIQVNSDNNANLSDAYSAKLDQLLSTKLSRFSEFITRIEVHLSDANGHKDGENDKQCMLEARLKGRQPIAVTDSAKTFDQSVSGAVDKLLASLSTIISRSRNH